MNIRIYNHYAVTPNFPGGTRHYDLASELAKMGHNVTVFASGFNYSSFTETQVYNNKGFTTESFDNLTWCWMKTTPYKENNSKRLFNMLSYSRTIKKISSKFPRPDIIIGSTVHPFAALAASKIARKFNVPFIYEIRDLWPQSLVDTGTWSNTHPAVLLFRKIEKKLVKRAKGIVVLSPKTKEYLLSKYGIDKGQVEYIPNGCRKSDYSFEESKPLINRLKFMYLGGVDSVHKLDHLLQALQRTKIKDLGIEFSITGSGKEKENLIKYGQRNKLDWVKWEDPVPKSNVPEKLMQADILFLPTAEVYYGSENKLSEYMMAAKPILSYTPAEHNDPAKLANCGVSSPYGNIEKLSENIAMIANLSPEERSSLGNTGKKYALENLEITILGQKINSFLSKYK